MEKLTNMGAYLKCSKCGITLSCNNLYLEESKDEHRVKEHRVGESTFEEIQWTLTDDRQDCESVYGCENIATKEIDDNHYCIEHYYNYLRDAEKYTGRSLVNRLIKG